MQLTLSLLCCWQHLALPATRPHPCSSNPCQRVFDRALWCRRVFHQGSTDHRGTPNHPGRTATLESAADCVTWGSAFRLAGSFEEQLETLQVLKPTATTYHSICKSNPRI